MVEMSMLMKYAEMVKMKIEEESLVGYGLVREVI